MKFLTVWRAVKHELATPLWNSTLQLATLGALLFVTAFAATPEAACQMAGLGAPKTAFSCQMGPVPDPARLWILAGLISASLCWGRCTSLLEKARRQQI